MDILEITYKQALSQNEEMIEKWKRCISEYICVKERIETFRNELSLKIMVPLGPKALMRGKLYHTNEILVHLGDGWFTRRSAHQALEICDRRIKNAEVMVQEFEQERSWLINKRDIPKMCDVFSNNERKEIIEDFNEETENEWRLKHAQNVKLYNQELARQRTSGGRNDEGDEYWQRLEELEIQEELNNEWQSTYDSTLSDLQNRLSSINVNGVESANDSVHKGFNDISVNNKNNYSNEANDSSSESKTMSETEVNKNTYRTTKNGSEKNLINPEKIDLSANLDGSVSNITNYLNYPENDSKCNSTCNHMDQMDEISNVVLLERNSNTCENLPLKMKLSYDFIGAFDDDCETNTVSDTSLAISSNLDSEPDKDEVMVDASTHCKPEVRSNLEQISNVKLLHRESNISENALENIKLSEVSLDTTSRFKSTCAMTDIIKELEENESNESSNICSEGIGENTAVKYDLLEKYKAQLIQLRSEMAGVTIRSHEELCKQLENYDLKGDLEHKILILQDELGIANDFLESESESSSDDSIYKTKSVQSEKSLKRVSFTEKDHTKYLDEDTPDPPLILHFRHSNNIPNIREHQNRIESPLDIYDVFKNCFNRNDKPYKSILKKNTSSVIKDSIESIPSAKEPGFGDSSKTQIVKRKDQVNNRSTVIGDVSENKTGRVLSDTKLKSTAATKAPISRFKAMRQTL